MAGACVILRPVRVSATVTTLVTTVRSGDARLTASQTSRSHPLASVSGVSVSAMLATWGSLATNFHATSIMTAVGMALARMVCVVATLVLVAQTALLSRLGTA